MFFNSSTLLFAGILVTAGVLIAWIVWFRRSRKRGRSVWNTEEPPPPTVADMPQVSLLEYPYSVSLIVRPDEPVNLVDAPLIRVSSPLTVDGLTAFGRIDVPGRSSRYAYFNTRAVGNDGGLLRARVNMFDVDASAPGRMPRGYPGDEDLFVFRSIVDVVAMPQPKVSEP
ncbi:MAG TPA: hypothetical protein PLA13_06815 [Microbacteriaceae bacterium]|jgi:hypothetical protein|nr:hypothetical protein [Microbacteriaceae bacterium]HQX36052.1 hypothetical protein [Microbacteriaceae bacterium]HQZ47993.1 hypothetical protein [Microbacteriaceae bacterium]HRA08180.1 hypothetical protein [Microbacteriaceae bacterium]